MALARSSGTLISSAAIANNGNTTSGVTDMLGDNTSVGDVLLYVEVISTVTAGTIDIQFQCQSGSGTSFETMGNTASVSIAPINGTLYYFVGRFPTDRYVNIYVLNNATSASATVTVSYVLEKLS